MACVRVRPGAFVNPEAPIDVAPEDHPTSEPQPDVIVLGANTQGFLEEAPKASDLALVVEIADRSLGFDLMVKARLYARAGIIEYWVLDVSGRRMIVHRQPEEGRYTSFAAFAEGENVSPLAVPHAKFLEREAFPR